LIKRIKDLGMRAGMAVKPATPIESVYPFADQLDQVLVMTVEPGFGGQLFMPNCMPKVVELRKRYPNLDIQVDGGLDLETVKHAAIAGANVIVAGSSIFDATDPKHVIDGLRECVTAHNIE
jgi:ribulose-phosphate 3-epimerase